MTLTMAPQIERQPPRHLPLIWHALALTALGAFTILLFVYDLGERALWSSHEGRAAQHAQRMIDSGEWGMPVLFFGESDYQKPPLYYWLVASIARWRGGVVDGWSVRLPAALAGVFGVCLVYVAGTAYFRGWTGLFAALIVACNLRYGWLARVGRIDMPLTVAVAIVLIAFYAAYRLYTSGEITSSRRRIWLWMSLAYVGASVAVMLKGPIGVVLTAVPVLLFLAWERQPIGPWQPGFARLVDGLGVWWGAPLTLGIVSPWFIWASATTHGAFFRVFFFHHHWDRTLGIEGLKPEPFWYYVPQLFLDAFPWSVLIPTALWWQWKRKNENRGSFGRLAACWVVGMFVVLSLVRFKRHDYLLPLVPGLGFLLAEQWDRVTQGVRSQHDVRWANVMSGVLATCACGIVAFLVVARSGLAEAFIRSSTVQDRLHDTDRMLTNELYTALVRASAGWLWMGACAALATFCAAWHLYRSRPTIAASLVAMAWLALFRTYLRDILPVLEPLREQRSIASAAHEFVPPDAPVYYYGREDQQLMYYLGPRMRWLLNRTQLLPVITQPDPVFVVMELERFEMRQNDWPDVTMVPVARNTENAFGTHRSPAVLVTNATGWRLVQSRRGGIGERLAN